MISRRSTPRLTTYQKARLQVVGYRTIQTAMNSVLTKRDINTSQWIIMGWLRDNTGGMRVTALADMLDVETPLITSLINPLQKRELVRTATDASDKRAKLLTLSEEGETFVVEVDEELATYLRKYEKGFKKHELDAYFAALEHFIANANQS